MRRGTTARSQFPRQFLLLVQPWKELKAAQTVIPTCSFSGKETHLSFHTRTSLTTEGMAFNLPPRRPSGAVNKMRVQKARICILHLLNPHYTRL